MSDHHDPLPPAIPPATQRVYSYQVDAVIDRGAQGFDVRSSQNVATDPFLAILEAQRQLVIPEGMKVDWVIRMSSEFEPEVAARWLYHHARTDVQRQAAAAANGAQED